MVSFISFGFFFFFNRYVVRWKIPHLKILQLMDVQTVRSSFHVGSGEQLISSSLTVIESDIYWIELLTVTSEVFQVLTIGKILQPTGKQNLQPHWKTSLLINGIKKPAMLVAFFGSFLFKILPCCPIKLLWELAFKLMVFFTAPAADLWQCFSIVQDEKSPLIQACGKDIHNVNPQRIYCTPKGVATW